MAYISPNPTWKISLKNDSLSQKNTFLKKITKTDKSTGKQYHYFRLCESYRIADKIRHRTILNLGALDDLNESERKTLAGQIMDDLQCDSGSGGDISVFKE